EHGRPVQRGRREPDRSRAPVEAREVLGQAERPAPVEAVDLVDAVAEEQAAVGQGHRRLGERAEAPADVGHRPARLAVRGRHPVPPSTRLSSRIARMSVEMITYSRSPIDANAATASPTPAI